MTLMAVCLTLVAQLPAKIPAGSVAVEGHESWQLFSGAGEFLADFSEIEGIRVASLRVLPKGGGVLFTGPRVGKNHGLFIKRIGSPIRDISISSGYHSWPAMSPRGDYVVFAHNPAADSGPMGAHGALANMQLWVLPFTNDEAHPPRQLTETAGCKSAPSFSSDLEIAFGHNSCRGTQGIEQISLSTAEIKVVEVNSARREMNPTVSSDGKRIAVMRGHYRDWQLVVADWPTMKQERVVARFSDAGEAPLCAWLADDKALLVGLAYEVIRVSVATGALTTVWRKTEGGR